MVNAINRQAAIDAFYVYPNINWTTLDVLKKINEIPTIQPKRGHWIEADVCGDITSWECSCCHNWTGLPTGWNVKAKLWFCPKCTADMGEVTTPSECEGDCGWCKPSVIEKCKRWQHDR